jgi:monofunctional glycosyltransferase
LRFLYFLSIIPFIVIGKLVFSFNLFGMSHKLKKCLYTVDSRHTEIPDYFISYLVAAEDHRSTHHFGIDPVGMLRAFYVGFTINKVQGASTIEQQFVRVVTSDYSHSLLRKFREQLLAIALTSQRSKNDIAKAYLAIAYYGYNREGTDGIAKIIGKKLQLISEDQVISIISRLKYPKPLHFSREWNDKSYWRGRYIKRRHEQAANKLMLADAENRAAN